MARTLYNEEGEAIQVPDEAEITASSQKVEESERRIAALEEEKKSLAEEINPNFRKVRENLKEIEKQRDEYKKALETAGQKLPGEMPTSREEIEQIAEARANKVALERYKESLLADFDDERRDTVKKYFEKLSAGEELNESSIKMYMADAASAAGLGKRRPPVVHGAPPNFKGAVSDTAKEMGAAFDISPEDWDKGGDIKIV